MIWGLFHILHTNYESLFIKEIGDLDNKRKKKIGQNRTLNVILLKLKLKIR